jgi:hypothetical protein
MDEGGERWIIQDTPEATTTFTSRDTARSEAIRQLAAHPRIAFLAIQDRSGSGGPAPYEIIERD